MADCRSFLRKTWSIVCLLTVEPALFLVSLGYGVMATATKVLLYNKVCIMVLDDIDVCVSRNFTSEEQEIAVQEEVSTWEFYQIVTGCIPAVFVNVVYANLVDRWSKKYTMMFCPAGYILSTIVYMIGAIYIDSSPAYMLLGSLVIGISGGLLTMLGACFSYLSATTAEGKLIIYISVAEAALLASGSVSYFLSGVLYDSLGYFYVYLIGIIINVLLAIYILARLKNIPPLATDRDSEVPIKKSIPSPTESLESNVTDSDNADEMPRNQPVEAATVGFIVNDSIEVGTESDVGPEEHPTETDSIPDENMGSTDPVIDPDVQVSHDVCPLCRRTVQTLGKYAKAYLNTVVKRRDVNKRSGIVAILGIIFVEIMCAYAAGTGLCYLFVTQEPLSWSTAIYGYYMGANRVITGFCLLVILPVFARLNIPYTIIMIISLVSSIFGSTVFAVSQYTWMAFLSAGLNIFHPALIVTARSFIVIFIDTDEHGKAFGIIATLESLSILLSSAVFNLGIYPVTVKIFSGLAILIASMLLLIPLATAIWLHMFVRKMTRTQLLMASENTA